MATQSVRRAWSYADFAALPDDGNRYEVIDGELCVTPAPRPLHQRVATRLSTVLEPFVERHRLGWVITGPIDVLFGPRDYLEPDLVFLRRENHPLLSERGIEGPPDLVVEILSASTTSRDRGIKRERYARHGVPEYWIVDIAARRVEVYHFDGDADAAPIVATEVIEWRPAGSTGPMLSLRLDDVLRGFD
jgi:Uma2 family endonuclease